MTTSLRGIVVDGRVTAFCVVAVGLAVHCCIGATYFSLRVVRSNIATCHVSRRSVVYGTYVIAAAELRKLIIDVVTAALPRTPVWIVDCVAPTYR